MKFVLHEKRLSYLLVQRNLFLGLVVALLLIAILQASFLFIKKERVIISPPELKQGYWVEGDRFSNSYLEEMALFFSHLLLDVSESNVLPQGEIVLRSVSPEVYGAFKAKLLKDVERLRKQQLTLHFVPREIEIVGPLAVAITGSLRSYVGANKVTQVQETYKISFTQNRGRLFLEAFEVIQSQQRSDHDEGS